MEFITNVFAIHDDQMKKWIRNYTALAVIALVIATVFIISRQNQQSPPQMAVSNFVPVEKDSLAQTTEGLTTSDSLVSFAKKLMGTPYLWAGRTPEGFDCSGFVFYVFGKFGLDVPIGSVNYASFGKKIPRERAKKGDIIVFTGTNADVRQPGHVGIVISEAGEPLEFIHASSATKSSYVKISAVDETNYDKRFLSVRRVVM